MLIVSWVLWLIPVQRMWAWYETPKPVKSEFYGLYEVDSFTRSDAMGAAAAQWVDRLRPMAFADRPKWKRVTIDERNSMMVIFADDLRCGGLRVIPTKRPGKVIVESVERGAKAMRREFTFARPAPDQLTPEGEFGEGPISVLLRRVDET